MKIRKEHIEDIRYLNIAQQGMLAAHLIDQDQESYVHRLSFTLKTESSEENIKLAYNYLLDKYSILRSLVLYENQVQALLIILKSREEDLIFIKSKDELTEIRNKRRQALTKIQASFLFSIDAYQIDRANICLDFSFHHLILDGWSLGLIVKDFFEILKAIEEDNYQHERETFNFKAYQGELNRLLSIADKKKDFKPVEGAKALTIETLPNEEKHLPFTEAVAQSGLDMEFGRMIAEFCAKEGFSQNVFYLSSWALFLAKFNRHPQPAFGFVMSGRELAFADIEKAVGMFIESLPITLDLTEKDSFSDLMGDVQDQILTYIENPNLRQEAEKVKALYVDHVFTFENYPIADLLIDANISLGYKITNIDFVGHTNFDFGISLTPQVSGKIDIEFKFDKSKYSAEYINNVQAAYIQFIKDIIQDPTKDLADYSLLSDQEAETCYREEFIKRDSNIVARFCEMAATYPDGIAVKAYDGELTYAELDAKSDDLAFLLESKGCKSGDVVAILNSRSSQLPVTILGILKLGAVYLTLETDFSEARSKEYLTDAACRAIILENEEFKKDWHEEFLGADNLIYLTDLQARDETFAVDINPDQAAYIIYTSGSTGQPKAIIISHANVINLVYALDQAIYTPLKQETGQENLNIGLISSLLFDASIKQIYASLLLGHTLCISSGEENSTGVTIKDYYKKYEIDVSDGTPTHMQIILNSLEEGEKIEVKEYLIGGEALNKGLVKDLYRVKTEGQDLVVTNVYGPSECTVDNTAYRINEYSDSLPDQIPIGKALNNVQCLVVDEKLKPLPAGARGELIIGGPSVGLGYLNNPDLTETVFVTNPYTGERMYRTGDIVRMGLDQTIYFLGREDNQVKVNGHRIELEEVEQKILALGEIKQIALVVSEEEDGLQRIVAFYVANQKTDLNQVKQNLQDNLPRYMMPALWIEIEELPFTRSRKIDRKALAEKISEIEFEEDFLPAETNTEKILAEFYCQVLKLKSAGRNSNFYALGGISLHAINLLGLISRKFSVKLTINEILANPVLEDLASLIDQKTDEAEETVIPCQRPEGEPRLPSLDQERIYALTVDEVGDAYHIQEALKITLDVTVRDVFKALSKLVNRYESLRSNFVIEDGELRVKVREKDLISLNTSFADELDNAELQDLLGQMRRPYDLAQDPLYRFHLVEQNESLILLLDFHHIIMDAWSLHLLLEEFFVLLENGELDEVNIQMSDYAYWQKEQRKLPSYKKHANLYNEYLNKAEISKFEVSTSSSKDIETESVSKSYTLELNRSKLQDIFTKAESTPYVFFSAVLDILLSKMLNKTDLTYATVVNARSNSNFSHLVGMLVNTSLIHVNPDPEFSFISYFNEKNQNLTTIRQMEYFNFQDLRKLENYPADEPSIIFTVEEDSAKASREGVENLPIDYSDAKYDLSFYVVLGKEDFKLRLECKKEKYPIWFLDSLARGFNNLLRQIMVDQATKLTDLTLSDSLYQETVLNEFNDTKRDYPRDKRLDQLFKETAELYPELPALIYRGESISYAKLDNVSDSLAVYLKEQGAKEEDSIAIKLDHRVWQIIAILASLKVGCYFLPIDTSYPLERQLYMIEDSKVVHLVTDRAEYLEGLNVKSTILNTDLLEVYTGRKLSPAQASSQTCAYRMYTSGTTSKPKGVAVSHRNIVRLVKNTNFMEFPVGKRFLQTSTIAFDASTLEIWGSLLNGMCLVLSDKEDILDPRQIKKMIADHEIYALWLSAPLFRQLVLEEANLFAGVKYLLAGGDVLPAEEIKLVRDLHPELQIINGYGPTENTTFSTTFTIDQDYETIPIGYPIANSRCYFLDKNNNFLLPGAIGELYVAGDGVAISYPEDPELTKEKFLDDPFYSGERMYKTGDMGYWDDKGCIHFLGRRDNQVKIRGFRIELGEIENVLSDSGKIDTCHVEVGEQAGVKNIHIYYVGQFSESDCRAYLRNRLPAYMQPGKLVRLEKFPLNANGKIDFKKLREVQLYRNDRDINEESEVSTTDALDSEIVEDSLADKLINIWQEVLGVEQVGLHDNYLELGGDSLLAIKLIGMIEQRTNHKLRITDILRQKTIFGLIQLIDPNFDSDKPERNAVSEYSDFSETNQTKKKNNWQVLAPEQEQILNAIQSSQDAVYHVRTKLLLNNNLKKSELLSALEKLHEAYPVLDTVYRYRDGWQQTRTKRSVEVISFSSANLTDLKTFEAEFEKKMDLEAGPLYRYALVDHEPDGLKQQILYISYHHSIVDGLSLQILLHQLQNFLSSESQEILVQSDSALDYINYAEREANSRQNTDLGIERDFWKNTFKENHNPPELETDYRRFLAGPGLAKNLSVNVSGDLYDVIRQASKDLQMTPYVLLLYAFAVWFYRYTGEKRVQVGIFDSGRHDRDLWQSVGMYVKTLPLKFNLPENTHEGLQKMQNNFLDILEHSRLSYREILDAISYQHQPGRNPLFDISFSYFNIAAANEDTMSAKELEMFQQYAKFDLSLDIQDSGHLLKVNLLYNTALWDETTVEVMLQSYIEILKQIYLEKKQTVSQISPLGDTYLSHLADQEVSLESKGKSLLEQLFSYRNSDQIAIYYGGKYFTYKDLVKSALYLSEKFAGKGIKKGDIVAVLSDAGFNCYVIYLAAMFAGAAFLPLDASYPEERLSYILENSEAKLLVAEDIKVKDNKITRFDLAQIDLTIKELNVDEINTEKKKEFVSDEDIAYVIYTSGSTGMPKGVQISYRALQNLCLWHNQEFTVTESTRTLKYAGIAFDASIWEVFPYLYAGASIYIPEPELRYDFKQLNQFLADHKVDIAFLPTSVCENFLSVEEPNVNILLTGGSKLFKHFSGSYKLYNNYGPAENAVVTTSYLLDEVTDNIPIGRAIPNCRVYILNEDMQPQPIGVPGEICIAGKSLSSGYLNNPEENSFRFLPDLVNSDELMYRSGDYAKFNSRGEILFLGRRDDQVSIDGVRIELAEIESAVMSSGLVKQVLALVFKPDQPDATLRLAIVAGEDYSPEKLSDHLEKKLPYTMQPTSIHLLEHFPLTANDKPDKQAVQAEIESQIANQILEGEEKIADEVEILSPEEEQMAKIWSELLELDQVSSRDNFFALGGNSIKAMQLIHRVQDELGITIKIADIFNSSNLSRLTRKVYKQDKGIEKIQLVRDPAGLYGPLSAQEESMISLAAMTKDSLLYNEPLLYRVNSDHSGHEIIAILREYTNEQPIFQVRYEEREGEFVRLQDDSLELTIDSFTVAAKKDLLDACLNKMETFSVFAGPLSRISLVYVEAEGVYYIFWDVHHILLDGASRQIIQKDLSKLLLGEPIPLKEFNYGDYARWQATYRKSDAYQEHADFWDNELAGESDEIFPEIDFNRQVHGKGVSQYFELEDQQRTSLYRLAAEFECSYYTVLLSFYFLTLAHYRGVKDIKVGFANANRNIPETEEMLGMFVNSLVIRKKLDLEESYLDFLARLKETYHQILDHQEYYYYDLYQANLSNQGGNELSGIETIFQLQNLDRADSGIIEIVDFPFVPAKFKLAVFVMDAEDQGTYFSFNYNKGNFTEDEIKEIWDIYHNMIDSVLQNKNSNLQELLTEEKEDSFDFLFA